MRATQNRSGYLLDPEPTPAELRALIPSNLDGITWKDPEWKRQWLVIGFALEFAAAAIENRATK